jgi:hypothetical protein
MRLPPRPNMTFPNEVERAYDTIRRDIVRTPLEFSPAVSRTFGARVFVKWECDQTTGSFKLRGALNKVRTLGRGDVTDDRAVVWIGFGVGALVLSAAPLAANKHQLLRDLLADFRTGHDAPLQPSAA